MVNFKVVVLFIKILTCFISHRTFGNVIYDIVQKYSQLSTSKLRKLEKLSIKLKKADPDITFLSNCKVFNVIPKFLAFNLPNTNDSKLKIYQETATKECFKEKKG